MCNDPRVGKYAYRRPFPYFDSDSDWLFDSLVEVMNKPALKLMVEFLRPQPSKGPVANSYEKGEAKNGSEEERRQEDAEIDPKAHEEENEKDRDGEKEGKAVQEEEQEEEEWIDVVGPKMTPEQERKMLLSVFPLGALRYVPNDLNASTAETNIV
jgi:hypothetical protein